MLPAEIIPFECRDRGRRYRIEPRKLELLCRDMEEKGTAVGRVCRKNVFEREEIMRENKEWINRIFSREKFQYVGRVHEQVAAIVGGAYETYCTDIVFNHTGYNLPPKERRKNMRSPVAILPAGFLMIWSPGWNMS